MRPPLLAICVPTYNRADHVAGLLECLDTELAGVDDTIVVVSDNHSSDGTAELLRTAAATRPWLQVHRQPENLGPVGNVRWLVEHAPPCEYVWTFGDDDRILPGAVADVVSALRSERPAWLFLPHAFVDSAQVEHQRSPAPSTLERFATAGELFKAYHHWLTFLSASIVRRDGLRQAVAEIDGENAYSPLLWFFRGGLDGPCAVLGRHAVAGGTDISWADRRYIILTLHYTGLWDDGLHAGLTEEEFGATLDGLYPVSDWGLELWRQQPLAELVRVVRRFPQSRSLRGYLWSLAREQDRRDVLDVLDAAVRQVGDDELSAAMLEVGEARFAAGEVRDAAMQFAAAAHVMPTNPTAWNDLAVALHELGEPAAAAVQLESALFVDPDDGDARENRAALLGAAA